VADFATWPAPRVVSGSKERFSTVTGWPHSLRAAERGCGSTVQVRACPNDSNTNTALLGYCSVTAGILIRPQTNRPIKRRSILCFVSRCAFVSAPNEKEISHGKVCLGKHTDLSVMEPLGLIRLVVRPRVVANHFDVCPSGDPITNSCHSISLVVFRVLQTRAHHCLCHPPPRAAR